MGPEKNFMENIRDQNWSLVLDYNQVIKLIKHFEC